MRVFQVACAAFLIGFGANHQVCADELPAKFVYLHDIAPKILQDIRYAGPDNFTGARVPGYERGTCILVRAAAEALARAQASLEENGLGLLVFDCYRPAQAVTAFVRWAKAPDNAASKRAFYPNIKKTALFPTYIATRSSHSKGISVDLTIVGPAAKEVADTNPCRGSRKSSAEFDMGTTFDCFDTLSRTSASDLMSAQRSNRNVLLTVMHRHGFKNYPGEWWHFTYSGNNRNGEVFDFPVK